MPLYSLKRLAFPFVRPYKPSRILGVINSSCTYFRHCGANLLKTTAESFVDCLSFTIKNILSRSYCGRQDLFWTPLSGLAWKAGSKTMPFYSLKRLTFPFVQPCKPSWFFGRKNLLPPQKRQPRQDKQGVSLTRMLMHWLRTESFADTQVHMARLKINKYKEVAYPSWMSVTWPTL